MREFNLWQDVEIVRELLDITMEELARELGVSRMTLNNWKKGKNKIPQTKMEEFYRFAFRNGVRLNKIKEQLYREDYADESHVVLFHGAKTYIDGELDLRRSRENNDFGRGFYCGESLEQSAMFVSNYPESSLYVLNFDKRDLQPKIFRVNQEWMLATAYFRGKLKEYEGSQKIAELLENMKDVDYIIAPIADNRIFEIIDSFIGGEITDVQCQHCLSATNLGNQYVFTSQKALKQVELLELCYLAPEEKNYYIETRRESSEINRDKVKLARKQYRGQGKYIEEIL